MEDPPQTPSPPPSARSRDTPVSLGPPLQPAQAIFHMIAMDVNVRSISPPTSVHAEMDPNGQPECQRQQHIAVTVSHDLTEFVSGMLRA